MYYWDLMHIIVSLPTEDALAVGENMQHMVTKLFTWQVHMQMCPVLCRTVEGYMFSNL